MLDTDTFATTLYVMIDDFLQTQPSPPARPGPAASLCPSEVVTLACLSQWQRFASERDFYRFALLRLRPAFPALPARTQFNRLVRACQPQLDAFFLFLVDAFFLFLADQLCVEKTDFQALDATALVTRFSKRRGEGWLFGQANIGYSNRVGFYEGFHLLLCVTPDGAIAGYSFAPASVKDQVLAEDFLALRRFPDPRLPSVGRPACGWYVTDYGFEGAVRHQRWQQKYAANVVTAPKKGDRARWPKALRRWLAGLRQIVESVNDKLLNTFRLSRERPHALSGLRARLTAKAVLHNFCFWLNGELGRDRLAFADLMDW